MQQGAHRDMLLTCKTARAVGALSAMHSKATDDGADESLLVLGPSCDEKSNSTQHLQCEVISESHVEKLFKLLITGANANASR